MLGLPLLPWAWPFEPAVLLGLAAAAVLYGLGLRYSVTAGLERRLAWWRPLCYAGGLLSLFIALESPLDTWANTYLWAHMAQHMLLIFLAPPLLLFGAPVMPIWRAIPLNSRRSSLRWLMTRPRQRRIAFAVSRFISTPQVVWVFFVGDFLAWHVPTLYDLTLQHQGIHDAEHLLFLLTALLFWAQIIPSAPLRPRLGYGGQAAFLVSAGFAMQPVALALTYAGTPLYVHYARAMGAAAAVADQTEAGALMNSVGAVVIGGVFMLLLWRWIDEAIQRDAPNRVPVRTDTSELYRELEGLTGGEQT